MGLIISLRQKNTLPEYMILSGANNRPPMLDKDLDGRDQNKENMLNYLRLEKIKSCSLRLIGELINDMNIYNLKMEQFQVNTKFLNSLPPEWSKFVTDVKLVKDLHTSSFDQIHAYLK
ncbi:hypothetical protein Tco_1039279 [Tanacetum coccineum]